MKINSKLYNFFIFYFLFSFLIHISLEEEQIFIEHEINIEEDNPLISLKIGEQEKKFYIYVNMPFIIAFEKQDGDPYSSFRYDPTKGNFNSKGINVTHPGFENNFLGFENKSFIFEIGEETISINNNETNVTIGTTKDLRPEQKVAGVYGLSMGCEEFQNIKEEFIYLNQLKTKSLISKKIFYIEPYYKNNEIIKKSKLTIGKIPSEFEGKLKDLPFCSLESSKYFDCKISSIIFEDNLSNKSNNTDEKSFEIKNGIIGRFEEGNLQETSLPKSFLEKFKEYFVEKKNCEFKNEKIDCSKKQDVVQNTNISIVINNFKFIISNRASWKNGQLHFQFTNDQNRAILMSSFIGNYHRIYDMENKKIYFSDVENNIIKLKSKNNDDNGKKYIFIAIIVGSVLLVILIIVIICLFISKNKLSDLERKVNTISFVQPKNEDEDEDEDQLL